MKKSKAVQGYTKHNQVKLIRGGRDYFNLLIQLINEARETIFIETYIYGEDETGTLVAEALKNAVKRKVKVFLMADGYASQALSSAFIKSLKSSGIHFRFFEPIFRSKYFYFGRRMHQKVAVFDSEKAMVGGVNIADRYNDLPGSPAWLDFALYVHGETARELCVVCWKTWMNYPQIMRAAPCNNSPYNIFQQGEQCDVRIRRNDWVRRKNEISASYIEMLRNARSELTILSSYFLPGQVIRRQIKQAVKRGVNIRVIAAGTSDIMTAKYAERWLYDWMLRNGIQLYEYQKNILHGKIGVCDDEWMTVGSYNINNISAYASIELNLDVRNAAFAKNVRLMLEDIISRDCIRITPERHSRQKNFIRQFVRWLSYQFIRTVFYLFTFYFKRRN